MDDPERMIAAIEAEAAACAAWTGRVLLRPEVLRAMRDVPRALFVPEAIRDQAHRNVPLGIGYRQTISQPFIVAIMTELLDAAAGSVVLEIGTGSGYQTAVLAHLVGDVCSVEIIPELARRAAATLEAAGYGHVKLRVCDGAMGWPERAPFDRIMVTAAAPTVPPALLAQLSPGGRMVIPVGPPGGRQELQVVEKRGDGAVVARRVLDVAFVPMTGGAVIVRPAARDDPEP